METFVLGTRICSGHGALEILKTLNTKRTLIVTDPFFEKNGVARRVAALCPGEPTVVFAEVVPDPPLSLIAKGVALLKSHQPDTLIALGGGSAIDCAKGMLSMYDKPLYLAAIPTTSGTGSEVTSFAIVTHEGVKIPLVEDRLRPALAILDDDLLAELPKGLIADAGMDVLSHCLEAVAAKNATVFSTSLASSSFRTALELLPASYRGDLRVRGAIHCAATMAGMAFDNAGLGLCHALSHALGGAFHIAHGRLNGILLPHVIRFNARSAPDAYTQLAAFCGLSGLRGLLFALERVRRQLALPQRLREVLSEQTALTSSLDELCAAALKDPCIKTNPAAITLEDCHRLLREAL